MGRNRRAKAVGEMRKSNATLRSIIFLSTMDYAFDMNHEIVMVRWNNNSIVTVASNHEPIEPMHRVKRWNNETKSMTAVEMPQYLKAYNQRMGGVDVFDNAMNNYRIGDHVKRGTGRCLPMHSTQQCLANS